MKIRTTAGVFGVLVGAAAFTAPAFACSQNARLSSGTSSGGADSEVAVTGEMFNGPDKGGPVDIRWGGTAGPVLTQAIGPRFTVVVRVPSDARAGVYFLSAIQTDDKGVAWARSVVYEVTPPPVPAAPISSGSGAGPVGPAEGSEAGSAPGAGSEPNAGDGSESVPGAGSELVPGAGSESDPGAGSELVPGAGSELDPGAGSELVPGAGSELVPATAGSDGPPPHPGSAPGGAERPQLIEMGPVARASASAGATGTSLVRGGDRSAATSSSSDPNPGPSGGTGRAQHDAVPMPGDVWSGLDAPGAGLIDTTVSTQEDGGAEMPIGAGLVVLGAAAMAATGALSGKRHLALARRTRLR